MSSPLTSQLRTHGETNSYLTNLSSKTTPKSVIFPFTNSRHPRFGRGVVFQHHGLPRPVRARKSGLLRRDLHAYRDHGAVGRHRAAAGGRAFGGHDGSVAPGSAIGGQEQFIVAALHRAVGRVAVRPNHSNAKRRAGRTGITLGTRRTGRPRVPLRARLALTAAQQRSGERNRNERPDDMPGVPLRRWNGSMCNFAVRKKALPADEGGPLDRPPAAPPAAAETGSPAPMSGVE